MQETALQILQKYWKHKAFRPLQAEIISAVLARQDLLALLPTGGGKSILYQVPALMMDGLCIVVSPLIALMKDQVDQLKRRGIQAASINSTLSRTEVEAIYQNIQLGECKFLYVSPELLQNKAFQERVPRFKVALIAVDEAHCISQWGYDFRPPYLKIAELRALVGAQVNIIAASASATQQVVEDIFSKLELKNPQLFKASFIRSNLSYSTLHESAKPERLFQIFNKVQGSGIVYVQNRKKTIEVATYLASKGISATYYHAGLPYTEREKRQDDWTKGRVRIMVATNAFGMGIDKAEVRSVVHISMPDSIESYYQEAGRAGRDGKKSFAIILWHQADMLDYEKKIDEQYPTLEDVEYIYQALGNHFQIPVNSGEMCSYDFDMETFSKTYKRSANKIFTTLKWLEKAGYVNMSEAFFQASRLMFSCSYHQLYDFEIRNPKFEPIIKLLLRSYEGILSIHKNINESTLVRRLSTTDSNLKNHLYYLKQQGIVDYIPQNTKPQITFVLPRQDIRYLNINKKEFESRRKIYLEKASAFLRYLKNVENCRSQQLAAYFGEQSSQKCGICDVCLGRAGTMVGKLKIEETVAQIKILLQAKPLAQGDLKSILQNTSAGTINQAVRWLMDENLILEKEAQLYWKD